MRYGKVAVKYTTCGRAEPTGRAESEDTHTCSPPALFLGWDTASPSITLQNRDPWFAAGPVSS